MSLACSEKPSCCVYDQVRPPPIRARARARVWVGPAFCNCVIFRYLHSASHKLQRFLQACIVA